MPAFVRKWFTTCTPNPFRNSLELESQRSESSSVYNGNAESRLVAQNILRVCGRYVSVIICSASVDTPQIFKRELRDYRHSPTQSRLSLCILWDLLINAIDRNNFRTFSKACNSRSWLLAYSRQSSIPHRARFFTSPEFGDITTNPCSEGLLKSLTPKMSIYSRIDQLSPNSTL